MTRSYHLQVEIEGAAEDGHDEVRKAVGNLWDYNSDYSSGELDYEGLRFTGYEEIGGSEPAWAFARSVSRDVWHAAGGYCPVRVYATLADRDPDDEFETSEADYPPATAPPGDPSAPEARLL